VGLNGRLNTLGGEGSRGDFGVAVVAHGQPTDLTDPPTRRFGARAAVRGAHGDPLDASRGSNRSSHSGIHQFRRAEAAASRPARAPSARRSRRGRSPRRGDPEQRRMLSTRRGTREDHDHDGRGRRDHARRLREASATAAARVPVRDTPRGSARQEDLESIERPKRIANIITGTKGAMGTSWSMPSGAEPGLRWMPASSRVARSRSRFITPAFSEMTANGRRPEEAGREADHPDDEEPVSGPDELALVLDAAGDAPTRTSIPELRPRPDDVVAAAGGRSPWSTVLSELFGITASGRASPAELTLVRPHKQRPDPSGSGRQGVHRDLSEGWAAWRRRSPGRSCPAELGDQVVGLPGHRARRVVPAPGPRPIPRAGRPMPAQHRGRSMAASQAASDTWGPAQGRGLSVPLDPSRSQRPTEQRDARRSTFGRG